MIWRNEEAQGEGAIFSIIALGQRDSAFYDVNNVIAGKKKPVRAPGNRCTGAPISENSRHPCSFRIVFPLDLRKNLPTHSIDRIIIQYCLRFVDYLKVKAERHGKSVTPQIPIAMINKRVLGRLL